MFIYIYGNYHVKNFYLKFQSLLGRTCICVSLETERIMGCGKSKSKDSGNCLFLCFLQKQSDLLLLLLLFLISSHQFSQLCTKRMSSQVAARRVVKAARTVRRRKRRLVRFRQERSTTQRNQFREKKSLSQ